MAIKLNQEETILAYVSSVEAEAKCSDKLHNEERSYAFILGYSLSGIETILKDLNLTQRQLKVLDEKWKRSRDYIARNSVKG